MDTSALIAVIIAGVSAAIALVSAVFSLSQAKSSKRSADASERQARVAEQQLADMRAQVNKESLKEWQTRKFELIWLANKLHRGMMDILTEAEAMQARWLGASSNKEKKRIAAECDSLGRAFSDSITDITRETGIAVFDEFLEKCSANAFIVGMVLTTSDLGTDANTQEKLELLRYEIHSCHDQVVQYLRGTNI